MPNRIIRESVWVSESLAKVSLLAQGFWLRLLPYPDDFGRFDARLSVMKGRIFPLNENVRAQEIEKWLQELASDDVLMIAFYTVGGVRYGWIPSWEDWNDQRAKRPRHPAPPDDLVERVKLTRERTRAHVEADADICRNDSDSDSDSETRGDAAEPVKRKRRPPSTGPVAVYHRAFFARFGVEPDVSKADAIAANELPADEAEALILAYVADDDPWVEKQGHALRFLKGQINRLRLKLAGKIPASTPPKGHARPLATQKDFETFPPGFLVRREEA